MKKMLCIIFAAALFLSSCAVVKHDKNTCETASECCDNITMGWNLGCSLSAYSEKSFAAFSALVYFTSTEGTYNRSLPVKLDSNTGTANVSWFPKSDDGVFTANEDSAVVSCGVSIWNFSLDDSVSVDYEITSLTVHTEGGDYALTDLYGWHSSDMGGGTADCGTDVSGFTVGEILSITASVCVKSVPIVSSAENVTRFETMWGNPATTPEMIEVVRDGGFNLIRAQVSWYNHMDTEGNIDDLWLDRVEEVVKYCMDAGVYCIINTSGLGWLDAEISTFDEQSEIYRKLWTQIAERFSGYGELLLFECFNEILTADKVWSSPPAAAYNAVNSLYQIFVDTVRASGGFNKTRNLVLNTYAASSVADDVRFMVLPTDTVENHLIAGVHCYTPTRFTFNETNLGSTDFLWTWGTDSDKSQLRRTFEFLRENLTEWRGVPVIIGEFGVVDRIEEIERINYLSYYAEKASENGIKLIVFDDGGDFALLDRKTLTWKYPQVIKALFSEQNK